MKENKESKGTQFEEEKILLTEDQVKDQTEIKEETEKDDMVENGVHNYSTEESYVWPTDPAVRKKLGVVSRSKARPYDALGCLQSVGYCRVLGTQRRRCLLVKTLY